MPITRGMIKETYIMVLSVKWLEEAFLIVRELFRSKTEG